MTSLKLLSKFFVAGVVMFLGTSAFAQAVSQDVDVTVTLTSRCRNGTVGTPSLDFGTYTAFQVGAQVPAAPAVVSIECTRSFAGAPVVSWDGGTAVGVVAGLQYTLTVTEGATTAGTAASTITIGTPDTRVFDVSGSMPAAQAGDSSLATTATRTLTLTF